MLSNFPKVTQLWRGRTRVWIPVGVATKAILLTKINWHLLWVIQVPAVGNLKWSTGDKNSNRRGSKQNAMGGIAELVRTGREATEMAQEVGLEEQVWSWQRFRKRHQSRRTNTCKGAEAEDAASGPGWGAIHAADAGGAAGTRAQGGAPPDHGGCWPLGGGICSVSWRPWRSSPFSKCGRYLIQMPTRSELLH